jgi:regulator of sirC expression with transglutaminase-like and TPR domain
VGAIQELVATIQRRVRNPTPEALIAQLHEVLFEELGFCGNEQSYYDLNNSLIPRVIETRRGIPITLTLLYKVVGNQLGLRIEGVNSPGHFLARVHLQNDTMLVDPFQRGRVLSPVEAVGLIERVVQQPWQEDEDWFPTCDSKQWLHRILNNLRSILIHAGNYHDVAAMRELQSVLNEGG